MTDTETCEFDYCHSVARRDGRCWNHQPSSASGASRTIQLTDKGLAAVGAPVLVLVPLLDIPYRKEESRNG